MVIIIWPAKSIYSLARDLNHGGGLVFSTYTELMRKWESIWGKSALSPTGVEIETFCT
jgi:hypothetical protein